MFPIYAHSIEIGPCGPTAGRGPGGPAGVFPPIIGQSAANAAIRVNNNCKFEIGGIRII
jgi:hypothetical protein